ncbi:MAG: permease-like cell division protein FtsX [Desulfuromonadales bacterium]|nr:permease-like cell division protein FtsX [Desulfuromonadales bacterium]
MLDKSSYFIRRALRNMRQWPFLCTASVLTMAVALASVATFFLVVMNVQLMATKWSEDLQVVAYLEQQPGNAQLAQLLADIEKFPEVTTVKFVSNKEAMQRFRSRLGGESDLLDGVREDILPASLELSLLPEYRNRTGVEQVVRRLEAHVDSGDIHYGQDWLERFETFVAVLKIVSQALGGFLLLAALFIVSNTIRLTLYARRDELEIMALVGATLRFIKVPFLLEGALQGLLGGVLALVILSAVFNLFLSPVIQSFWLTPAGIELVFLDFNQQLLLVSAGVLLGIFGSLSSLRKLVQI